MTVTEPVGGGPIRVGSKGIERMASSFLWRVVAVVALVTMVMLNGCSSGSGLEALDRDPSQDTIAGPRPTAPPVTDYNGPGLTADATELLSRLRNLESERNLCAILTSSAVGDVLGGEAELSSLATTPAGIAQLIVDVDRFFAHIVDVAPADIAPSMAVLQRTWREVAEIGVDVGDREQRTRAILESPQVRLAVDNLGTWMKQNCGGALGVPTDLEGLLAL